MALSKQGDGKVLVWFHSLPWLKEAEKPTEFELGEIYLNRRSSEVIYLLEKLGGDAKEFRGHLPLKYHGSRWPFLVYCNDSFAVKDNNAFLEALLFDTANMEELDEDEDLTEEEHVTRERPLRHQNHPKIRRAIPRKSRRTRRKRQ